MATPFAILLKGLREHEKEGRPLLSGRLPPTTERLLSLLLFHSGQRPVH
jgi:hypothetical protein